MCIADWAPFTLLGGSALETSGLSRTVAINFLLQKTVPMMVRSIHPLGPCALRATTLPALRRSDSLEGSANVPVAPSDNALWELPRAAPSISISPPSRQSRSREPQKPGV